MKISIIIPAYHEAAGIKKLITHLRNTSEEKHVQDIIVVDGDSSDNTAQKAREAGATVLASSRRQRAYQMNLGAGIARGDIFYFLHADSFPPDGFDRPIINSVHKGYLAGCFRMRFDTKHPLLKFSEWFTRLNHILCRGGDQSLFITRDLFEKTGGFNEEFQVMEDIEIIQHIKKHTSFKIIPRALITSARKYEINGYFRLQFLFALIHLQYLTGVPPQKLRSFYNLHIT